MKRPTFEERFFALVVKHKSGCWRWQNSVRVDGYGRIRRNGVTLLAHRAGYELLVGPIPTGHVLHHRCGLTACVNPAHLQPVTQREHVLELSPAAISYRRRRATHCFRGHALTPDNIMPGEYRVCRACHRIHVRRDKERRNSDPRFREAKARASRRYRERHADALRVSKAEYQRAHRDQVNEYQRNYKAKRRAEARLH